ncbi:hypothetical protein TrRE_jg6597, partial [Triparma retinervis]
FCTGAAGKSFCHLGDIVLRTFDRTLYVDGHGRVFARGPYDKGNLRELEVAWDNEGYANVAVFFATNFIPLPYKSKIRLATLQWAGVFGDRFILHETVDHLEEKKFENGIADTQPASKAENMARQRANERDLPEDEKEMRKLQQEKWIEKIETRKKEKKDEKEKRKREQEMKKKEKKDEKEKRKREQEMKKKETKEKKEKRKKEKTKKRKREKEDEKEKRKKESKVGVGSDFREDLLERTKMVAWVCEACGCNTNADDAQSCGLCGTRRGASIMQGMLRRTGGLFHVTGGDSDFEAGAMLDYDDVMNHREGRDNDE